MLVVVANIQTDFKVDCEPKGWYPVVHGHGGRASKGVDTTDFASMGLPRRGPAGRPQGLTHHGALGGVGAWLGLSFSFNFLLICLDGTPSRNFSNSWFGGTLFKFFSMLPRERAPRGPSRVQMLWLVANIQIVGSVGLLLLGGPARHPYGLTRCCVLGCAGARLGLFLVSTSFDGQAVIPGGAVAPTWA